MGRFDNRLRLRERVMGFFKSLARRAIVHPRSTLIVAAFVILCAAPGIRWLTLRTDGNAFVSPTASEVAYDKSIRDQFGIEDYIVVLVHSELPEGIFNPSTIQLVRRLTTEFAQIPGIGGSSVMSLATEPSFRLRQVSFIPQTLLEPPMTTKPELEQLRDDLRSIELYTGTLVSTDGDSTVVLIGVPSNTDRARLCGRVFDVIAATHSSSNEIAVTG